MSYDKHIVASHKEMALYLHSIRINTICKAAIKAVIAAFIIRLSILPFPANSSQIVCDGKGECNLKNISDE